MRLRIALGAAIKFVAGKVTVTGLEKINKVAVNRNLVIATTHLTDEDLPISSAVLSQHLDLALTDMSPNHQWPNPLKLLLMAAGESNFIPIDFNLNPTTKSTTGIFNPKNFIPMIRTINDGKRLVIAAHNPSNAREFPCRPGVAVPYVSAFANADILPVAVTYEKQDKRIGMANHMGFTVLARSGVNVSIGDPIRPIVPPIIDELKLESSFCDWRHKISTDEFRIIKTFLKQQGELVVDELKNLTYGTVS